MRVAKKADASGVGAVSLLWYPPVSEGAYMYDWNVLTHPKYDHKARKLIA